MNSTIVLIGPIGVGKSTQGQLLSERLGLPRCSYDAVKGGYWKELGLDIDKAQAIEKASGVYAMIAYMNEYKAKTVESIVLDHPGHVIDFGGGAQTFDEPHQVARVKRVFDPLPNVFLMLPSPDLATSIEALPGLKEDYPINAYLINHPTNEVFAKKTLYTLGKTPSETADEILSHIV